MPPGTEVPELVVERYKFILQQIHTVNENVYRFLAIFQALATALATAAVALVTGYTELGLDVDAARLGVRALLVLITLVAAFTVLMVVVGVASWFDYRREECELVTRYFDADFRRPPVLRNFYRWYETYVVLFVALSVAALWVVGERVLVPRIS